MAKAFFITGTDTGVGKTLVASALLRAAGRQGLRAFGLKPVAAGCQSRDGRPVNEDALELMAASSLALPYEQVNPVALNEPIAPHIAATRQGRRLDLDRLEGYVRGALTQPADLVVIEGAGGWRVPLNPHNTLADLAQRLNIPVILVVGIRLGCLNHALLTAEAIQRDGLPLAGWVANVMDSQMPALEENIATLGHCLPAPCLGRIPQLPTGDGEAAVEHLRVEGLLG